MSMLSRLWKNILAAFRKKIPGWLMEAADSAVQMVEILAAMEGVKGETKRQKAIEFLRARLKQLGKSATQVAIETAIAMAVNALEQPSNPTPVEKTPDEG